MDTRHWIKLITSTK